MLFLVLPLQILGVPLCSYFSHPQVLVWCHLRIRAEYISSTIPLMLLCNYPRLHSIFMTLCPVFVCILRTWPLFFNFGSFWQLALTQEIFAHFVHYFVGYLYSFLYHIINVFFLSYPCLFFFLSTFSLLDIILLLCYINSFLVSLSAVSFLHQLYLPSSTYFFGVGSNSFLFYFRLFYLSIYLYIYIYIYMTVSGKSVH